MRLSCLRERDISLTPSHSLKKPFLDSRVLKTSAVHLDFRQSQGLMDGWGDLMHILTRDNL